MPNNLLSREISRIPIRNLKYLPFYYFIPESYLRRSGAELNSIPRTPRELFQNPQALEVLQSDLFMLLIYDVAAYLVWPFMGKENEYMEIYSGYDPAWKLAHTPDYWIKGLTDEGVIPPVDFLLKNSDMYWGYVPEYQAEIYLRYVVPKVMKKHNMYETLEISEQYRCFEDFDFRDSRQKNRLLPQMVSYPHQAPGGIA